MPSQGEDLAVLSLCNHSIIGVRWVAKIWDGWRKFDKKMGRGGFGQNMVLHVLTGSVGRVKCSGGRGQVYLLRGVGIGVDIELLRNLGAPWKEIA